MNRFRSQIITAIDVGTTKICVLIARYDAGSLEILGIGKSISEGLSKGVVVDVAKTIQAITLAVGQAEKMANMTVEKACIGIAGSHIQSYSSHGVVPIKRGTIRPSDVSMALTSAQTIAIDKGQQILHVLPQYFVIDGGEKIHNPIDMHGIRLEVKAHVITGSIASAQNLVTCCERAGIEVTDIILEPLASAAAVLSKDEQQFGVAVIDIGGGTTDVAVYQHGAIRFTKVIPVAGNHFTNDLAIGLRVTCADAERIKKEFGSVRCNTLEKESMIEGEMVQEKDCQLIAYDDIVSIIRPRAYELFALVKAEFDDKKLYSSIATGVVLTGGGSLLQGMRELAEDTFGISVRIGYPRVVFDLPVSLQHPMYATVYGMLVYMVEKQEQIPYTHKGKVVRTVFDRMKMWVTDFF